MRNALVMLTKALEIDPKFAMAHAYLAATYEQLNDLDREEQQLREAALLADRVTEPERRDALSTLQAAEHFEERGGDCLGGTRRDRSELPH